MSNRLTHFSAHFEELNIPMSSIFSPSIFRADVFPNTSNIEKGEFIYVVHGTEILMYGNIVDDIFKVNEIQIQGSTAYRFFTKQFLTILRSSKGIIFMRYVINDEPIAMILKDGKNVSRFLNMLMKFIYVFSVPTYTTKGCACISKKDDPKYQYIFGKPHLKKLLTHPRHTVVCKQCGHDFYSM